MWLNNLIHNQPSAAAPETFPTYSDAPHFVPQGEPKPMQLEKNYVSSEEYHLKNIIGTSFSNGASIALTAVQFVQINQEPQLPRNA